MNFRNKWTLGLLSLGAAAIVAVSATTAYSVVYAQDETEQPATMDAPRLDRAMIAKGDHSAILAEVLGITEAELQTAMTTARNAAIDQAVVDGTLTQEQADAMQAGDGGRGFGRGADDAQLAAALGITEAELAAAKDEVQERVIAEAVTAGEITQEAADMLAARQALQEYLQDRLQSAYEDGVAQAVADGVITQTQADQILSEQGPGFFGPGMGGPRGVGPGGHHGGPIDDMSGGDMRGDGMRGGPGRGSGMNESPLIPEDVTPEDATPESSNGPVVPANALDL
jgi:hypothetical protein